MKKKCLKVLAALLLLASMFSCFPMNAYADDDVTYETVLNVSYDQASARSMLPLVNDFRTGNEAYYKIDDTGGTASLVGELPTFSYSYALEEIAMQRAAEIAVSFGHGRPDGTFCFSCLASDGSQTYAENIAAGCPSAEAVSHMWREDDAPCGGQGHRINMLSRNEAIGIGHAVYNGVHYWVQEFGEIGSMEETAEQNGCADVGITVAARRISSVQSLSCSENEIRLTEGAQQSLPAVCAQVTLVDAWPSPTAAITAIPSWQCSDESVVRIENGQIRAMSTGEAELSASFLSVPVSVTVYVTASQMPIADEPIHEAPPPKEAAAEEMKDQATDTCEHDFTILEEDGPWCTEVGHRLLRCVLCGYEAEKTLEPTGHTVAHGEGQQPTCTQDGWGEGDYCMVCGKALRNRAFLHATGHVSVKDPGRPATETETGLTEGSHCAVCGMVLEAQQELPLLKPTNSEVSGGEGPPNPTEKPSAPSSDTPQGQPSAGRKPEETSVSEDEKTTKLAEGGEQEKPANEGNRHNEPGKGENTKASDRPNTGDPNRIGPLLAVIALSAMIVVLSGGCLLRKCRRKN